MTPLAAHERPFTSARAFRAFIQRSLRTHLADVPEAQPLARLPRARRLSAGAATLPQPWHSDPRPLLEPGASLASLPIDHTVPVAPLAGGSHAAAHRLDRFLKTRLPRYAAEHADPDADCTSRLSPYLHFGHFSSHQVFSALMTQERWTA